MADSKIVEATAQAIASDLKLLKTFLDEPDRIVAETSGRSVDIDFVQAVIDGVKALLDENKLRELDDAELDQAAAAGYYFSRISNLKPQGYYSRPPTNTITFSA